MAITKTQQPKMLGILQNHNMKKYRFVITLILVLFISVVPFVSSASIAIPCGKGEAMCSFNDLFVLINNIIKFFLVYLLLPFVILLIVYSGFLFMFSGANEEMRTKGKKIFKNIVIGILLILGSWFIVYTLFKAFGYDTSRGKAGLSDSTVNWRTNTTSGGLLANVGVSGFLSNIGSSSKLALGDSIYKAELVANSKDPKNTKVTVTINPTTKVTMSILVSCTTNDGNKTIEAQGKISANSSVGTVNLNLEEDTSYVCSTENTEGTLSGGNSFTTMAVTPGLAKNFKILTSKFTEDSIILSYDNADSLFDGYSNLNCKNNGADLISNFGVLFDQSQKKGDIVINLPIEITKSLKNNTNMDCVLDVYLKSSDPKTKYKPMAVSFSGVMPVVQNSKNTINTMFAISRVDQKSNSIDLTFNGSIDVDPNMDLVCVSYALNHKYQSKVYFDVTAINKKSTRSNKTNSNGTIDSPITIPVVWSGFGLRPNGTYSCQLSGRTLKNIAGYEDQPIKNMQTVFNVYTPSIPLIKGFESKLSYPVLIGTPRIFYKTYTPPQKPLSQIPVFKQAVPDSVVVPVLNGLVVDDQNINLSCNQIMGPASGSWTKLVGLDNADDNNKSKIIESIFSIEISKSPATGFMHSSVYSCLARFFIEGIPQIRGFTVTTPFYIDPQEVGPIEMRVDGISTNKEYAFFNLIASHRIESQVNYICNSSNGNYSGDISWVAQSLGVRLPVAIPISDSLPGLKTKTMYNCTITGSTYQKEQIRYQFNIKTP